mmetsp:Transcript_16044/g.24174  ORF Transcript_16044/g.24174 Transcript_16044/m.24174 type:complete len:491 (-) Transcript_16044:88-1560(-)|eukprot:CAMPEP_0167749196 /NCGR_PEP_ID=MMETSP0110_2-20121227/5265_1 /TAXON_ID=629695 /ORGANISM="Gymnochlora sp., Strain CCMP2014" /LENGTH=490 /DNA_ID=CAMNT_0007634307 /DNA_START=28 /DNA_END=1500 /DNA_ORIENTATION=-
MAGQGPTVIQEINAKTWTIFGGLMISLTIFTTYVIYVIRGGQIFLPTISHTWEDPPGTYLSRFFVGYGTDVMYVAVIFIYWARVNARHAVEQRYTVSEKTLLIMGMVGIFCLSWVPPICDSSKPTCRGYNPIHDTFAVTFFVLYTAYLIIIQAQPMFQRSSSLRKIYGAFTFLSIITKTRFFIQLFAHGSTATFPILAVFEWTDTTIIVTWTCVYVSEHCQHLSWAIVHWSKEDRLAVESEFSDETVGPYIGLKQLRLLALTFCILTLVTTLIAGIITQTLPKDVIPFISDMWVYIPGDWISRWGTIRGCWCSIISQIMLYYSQKEVYPTLTVISIISLLGLSIVGSVNEQEDHAIHTFGAVLFFVLFDIYIIITASINPPNVSKCTIWGLTVFILFTHIRHLLPHIGAQWRVEPDVLLDIEAFLEWSDTFCIIAFMYLDVFYRDHTDEVFNMIVTNTQQRNRKEWRRVPQDEKTPRGTEDGYSLVIGTN